MTFEATVYRVLIASPSDLDEDRKAIADAIHEWNSIFAAEREIMLLPVMWETDAIPETGGRPQGFINERLVKPADIIIGAFWTRVGSPTGVEESGTIEEIKEGLKAGKKVMLYFSENDWPRRLINTDQHQKLEEFRQWCRQNTIYREYQSAERLKHLITGDLSRLIHDIKREDSTNDEKAFDVSQFERKLDPNDPIPAHYVSLLADAAQTEFIRQSVGNSPLDTGLMRGDLEQKACLSLTGIGGSTTNHRNISIPFRLRNEGRHPAYDVTVSVDRDGETILSEQRVPVIKERGGEYTFKVNVSRPPQQDPPEEHFWVFTVRTVFRDGLGKDEASFEFTFGGKDRKFTATEDESQAKLSQLCRYIRPA